MDQQSRGSGGGGIGAFGEGGNHRGGGSRHGACEALLSVDRDRDRLVEVEEVVGKAQPKRGGCLSLKLDGLSRRGGGNRLTILDRGVVGDLQPVVPPSDLALSLIGGEYILSWTSGVLQSAATLTGSFTDVTGASSPYPMVPSAGQNFYRLRSN